MTVFLKGRKLLYKLFRVKEYNSRMDWMFKPAEEGKSYRTMRQFGPGEISKISSERFHNQSRREYYIDKLWRKFFNLKDVIVLKELRMWLSYQKNIRAFYKARKITLKSWTVFNSDGEKGGWDGWVEFEGGKIGLDGYVVKPNSNRNTYRQALEASDDWNYFNEVSVENGGTRPTRLYFDMIYIPCDVLTPELLEEAIKRWYQSKVRWKFRHWTWKEQAMPEIIIDVPWESYSKEHGIGEQPPGMHAIDLNADKEKDNDDN